MKIFGGWKRRLRKKDRSVADFYENTAETKFPQLD